MSIGKEDTIYNRLQNTYFATLSLAVNVVNLLLILPAPKSSWWRRWGIFAMSCSLCGVVIHLGFVIGMPNLWDMRIAWVITDVFCLFALIFSIQAAALSKSHIRELALLTAAAAAFVLRYVVKAESKSQCFLFILYFSFTSLRCVSPFTLSRHKTGTLRLMETPCMSCFSRSFQRLWFWPLFGRERTCCWTNRHPRR